MLFLISGSLETLLRPTCPSRHNLDEVFGKIDPDIVHLHRSGYHEWPGFKHLAPRAKWIETNIFGYNDHSRPMDVVVYISEYIRNKAYAAGNIEGPMIFNPIEMPTVAMTAESKDAAREKLLTSLKLPKNAILLGRVGRADNFDGISLRAFKDIERLNPNTYYLVVNPCESWRVTAKELGLNNVRFLEPIIDDHDLSQFYLGLDIYAHARHDGECCPCNIQEAMMHGIPVVSHESAIHNGQSEIIADSGFVVPFGDSDAYRDVLQELINNPELMSEDETTRVRLRDYFGRVARRRAMRYWEASCVTATMCRVYDWALENVK